MIKDIIKTKTFWVGLGTICAGIGAYFAGEIDLATLLTTQVAGFLSITFRDAIKKIE